MARRVVYGRWGYWNIIDDPPDDPPELEKPHMASRTKVIIGLGVAGGLGFAAWLASRAGASGAAGPFAGVKPAGSGPRPSLKFGGLPTPEVFKGDEVALPGEVKVEADGTRNGVTHVVIASRWDSGWFHSFDGGVWYPDSLLQLVVMAGESPSAATWTVRAWEDRANAAPPA